MSSNQPTTTSAAAAPAGERSGSGDADNVSSNESKPSSTTGSFECNICLDAPQDAVVSMCGHLFCWSCIHRWIESRPVCPVCKAAISVEKVIPLYGRGSDHTRDPRSKIPPRPPGQRVEPEQNGFAANGLFGNFFGGPDGGNFRMSVGIGAFPLGFLATAFSFGVGPNNGNTNPQSNWTTNNETLSKFCFGLAIFFIAWLLIA